MVIVILSPSAWRSPPRRTPKNPDSITRASFRTRNRAEGQDYRPFGKLRATYFPPLIFCQQWLDSEMR